MSNAQALENFYKENLEEALIGYLAKKCNFSLKYSMDLYYHSKLCNKINKGLYDIQYLDEKVLVDILIETEPELFVS